MLECKACGTFVDVECGWIREPNGDAYCWPCYENGKTEPKKIDHEASLRNVEAEHVPYTAEKPKRKPKEHWGIDAITGEYQEGERRKKPCER